MGKLRICVISEFPKVPNGNILATYDIIQRIRANWFVGKPVRSFALLDFEIEGEILDKKMNWCFVIV